MERLDEKLPDFRLRFKRAAAEGIGVHGNPAPADDAEALGLGRGFNSGASFVDDGRRKKGCGSEVSRPAPSPLAPSASTPPR